MCRISSPALPSVLSLFCLNGYTLSALQLNLFAESPVAAHSVAPASPPASALFGAAAKIKEGDSVKLKSKEFRGCLKSSNDIGVVYRDNSMMGNVIMNRFANFFLKVGRFEYVTCPLGKLFGKKSENPVP